MEMWKRRSVWLLSGFVVLLACGLFFRFTNLGQKFFWHDETETSRLILGYSSEEITEQIFDGHEIGPEELQKYNHFNSERSLSDVISILSAEDPKHPPLYYGLARIWAQIFGDSVVSLRGFSALISLLALPCLYWLCIELFESPPIAWMATAMMAVSPFHVLYSQEARQYSLWTLTTLFSSALLLRAMRLRTGRSWVVYGITVALGLYSHTLFVIGILAHGIYIVGAALKKASIKEVISSRILKSYVVATIAGLLAFLPWAILIALAIPRLKANTSWLAQDLPLFNLIKQWGAGLITVFIDTNDYHHVFRPISFQADRLLPLFTYFLVGYVIRLPVLILAGYSVYFLYRKAPNRIWLFVFALIGAVVIALVLPDLIFGGRRSSPPRYMVPMYLGIQMSVAYLFVTKINSIAAFRRRVWQAVATLVIVSGIVSCAIISSADAWWNKTDKGLPQIASIINQSPRPLLIASTLSQADALSLSRLLDTKVRIRLTDRFAVSVIDTKIDAGFSDVFLIDESGGARRIFEKDNYLIEAVYQPGELWRVTAK